jgi:hypothetical protein
MSKMLTKFLPETETGRVLSQDADEAVRMDVEMCEFGTCDFR